MCFEIRTAAAGDAADCARVQVLSWAYAYAGLLPAQVLAEAAEQRPTQWRERLKNGSEHHFVAVWNDRVVGFAVIGAPDDPDPGFYELTAIYLDPAVIGRGYGRRLLAWVEDRLRAMGYAGVCLWVLEGNASALRFYERNGFRLDGARKPSTLADTCVLRCRKRLAEPENA